GYGWTKFSKTIKAGLGSRGRCRDREGGRLLGRHIGNRSKAWRMKLNKLPSACANTVKRKMQNAEQQPFRILQSAISPNRMSSLRCDLCNIPLVSFLIINPRELRYLMRVMTAQPSGCAGSGRGRALENSGSDRTRFVTAAPCAVRLAIQYARSENPATK